ncbi:hypothetical protein [Croceiramulus getboli]|nr:hypothetical protein P8624_09225 [Flavobacteriaceae bacterium YJPT1-3]
MLQPIKSTLDRALELLTFVLIVASALLLGVYYNQLPEHVPLYFNWPSKDANGLGAKDLLWTNPLLFGVIAVGLHQLLKHPSLFNYPTRITHENARFYYTQFTRMFRWLGLVLALLCFCLTLASVVNGLGNPTDFDPWLYPLFPILLVGVPGVFLVKVIGNRF